MTSQRKRTIQVKAQVTNADSLRYFWGKLPQLYQDNLEFNYGKIFHLFNVPVQLEAITCLAQFYDPPLRCFTFKDFLLAPTLEEIGQILRSSNEMRGVYTDIGRIPKISDLAPLLEVPNLPSFYKGVVMYKVSTELSWSFYPIRWWKERDG